ncbi:MAG: ChbG/HpnK family deacetylase [Eubacteriales bacterium]|nr:ChbG/HpnK family deacetylase [Eubacteriales bacterium]
MSAQIDIHADDFGESLHASLDILDCLREGCLDSISVLANMSCFADCVEHYRRAEGEFPQKPLISVHINLMEGSCLAGPGELPDLTDEKGHFCISWEKLFFRSWLPGQRALKEQLKKEILLQIRAVTEAFPELGGKLRLDSHQHTHMIPVVARALFEVLEENGWTAVYIRDAREPLWPFLREVSLYRTYRPVNFVKNILLNYCSVLLQGRLRRADIAPMYLWGLVMSGHMDEERVRKLLPAMERRALGAGRRLEILFHPGHVLPEEISEEFSQADAIAFHVSPDREVEKRAVQRLALAGGRKNEERSDG